MEAKKEHMTLIAARDDALRARQEAAEARAAAEEAKAQAEEARAAQAAAEEELAALKENEEEEEEEGEGRGGHSFGCTGKHREHPTVLMQRRSWARTIASFRRFEKSWRLRNALPPWRRRSGI